MHNKPHLVSEKQAKHALDLLHADLLELPIESYHKKRWCLLVLDDYSSYSYMALLQSKSETFENIKQIVQTMEN